MLKHWGSSRRRAESASIAALRSSGKAVFDAHELSELVGGGSDAARQRIHRLVKAKVLVRHRWDAFEFRDPAVKTAPTPPRAALLHAALGWNIPLAYETGMAAHGLEPIPRRGQLKLLSEVARGVRTFAGGWSVRPFPLREDSSFQVMDVPGFGEAEVLAPEALLLDGLELPGRVSGGVETIARFMRLVRDRLNVEQLVASAIEARRKPTVHRLGLLLDMSGLLTDVQRDRLRAARALRRTVLDPTRRPSRNGLAYWQLDVNVPYPELAAALGVRWPPTE